MTKKSVNETLRQYLFILNRTTKKFNVPTNKKCFSAKLHAALNVSVLNHCL